jgi:maltose alpha-D-glucosyltransferase/alpha-amylase
MTVLPLENPAVLAFVRAYEDEKVLVLANLSRFAQSTFLPPHDDLRGLVPMELLSQACFPALGDHRYHVMLGPHQFYWFALLPEEVARRPRLLEAAPAGEAGARGALPRIRVPEGLHNLLVRTMAAGEGMERLEAILPEFLQAQRWFGAKGEPIAHVRVADAVRLLTGACPRYLALLDVTLDGRTDTYLLPLTTAEGARAGAVLQAHPHAALAWLDVPSGRVLLYDAAVEPRFWVELFAWWLRGGKGRSLRGLYTGEMEEGLRHDPAATAVLLSGEQSNSAAVVTTEEGERVFVKLYRRLERGVNPEVEVLGHLTGAGFRFVPRLLGTAQFRRGDEAITIGVAQQALPAERDGWDYAVEKVGQFLGRVAATASPDPDAERGASADGVPPWMEETAPEMLELARTLGVRTAELHAALAGADAPALRPLPATVEDHATFAARVAEELEATRALLGEHAGALNGFPDDDAWDRTRARLDALRAVGETGQRVRVHGDYHLGQTLVADGEVFLLDFEGEPARPLEERRRRDYALRDVAGMLRSLNYAAFAPLLQREEAAPAPAQEAWAGALARGCEATFLDAYYRTAGDAAFVLPPALRRPFLWAYLLDKALYEVRYELGHRPAWVRLPLRSLQRLLREPAEAATAA